MKQSSLINCFNDNFEAMKTYLQYTKEFSESPPEFHLATYFQTVACIIGRMRYIIQGEDKIYPNLYTLAVAPSSLFKKTSSIGLVKKWLQRLKIMGIYIGQIGSPEGLFAALQENGGKVLSFYSEAGLLLSQAASKRYMGDILELLNDLYDCPDYYRKRLTSGTQEAKNICMNLIGASQLDSLTKYVKESDLLSGFLPRFQVVYASDLGEHMVKRPEPNKQLQNKILYRFNDIRKACSKESPMDLTPEAWEYFEDWGHDKYQQALIAPPTIQPMYGRLESHALKMAIIIHLSRYPEETEIDLKSIVAGCDQANHIINSYRHLIVEELAFTIDQHKLKKIETIIKQRKIAPNRDVANYTKYRTRDLDELLKTLVVMGKIECITGERGGKSWKWIG